MNQPAYFEIQADDVPHAAAFYKQVFGWSVERDDGMPIEYWRVETEGLRGAILARPAPAPPGSTGTNAYIISIEVLDFDATAALIAKLGGTVALAKFAVRGKCWQGYFVDPAGNTFGIFEVDVNAR